MKQRVYVTQYDASWSLTRDAWRRACELAVAGEPFNWDDLGHQLKRKCSKWDKQFQTLDWDKLDWEDALENTKEDA